jgi:undecaprenyl pyrophosphate phosphatase UppP
MEFIITDKQSAENQLKHNQLIWKNFDKKNRKNYAISIIIGVLIILMGIFGLIRKDQVDLSTALLLGVGMGTIYGIFIIYRQNVKRKKISSAQVAKYIALNAANEIIVKINDSGIETQDDLVLNS